MSSKRAAAVAFERDLAQKVARYFYAATALVLVVAALLLWNLAHVERTAAFSGGLLVAPALAAALAVAAWHVRRGHVRDGIGWSLIALAAAAVAAAFATGRGLHAVMLGMLGLVVPVAAVVLGRRPSVLLAVAAGASLVAMYYAEQQGWLGAATPIPSLNLLLTQTLLLLQGLLFGWMLAEIVQASAHAAGAGQQRFRALLRIASDWYWEQDRNFRFTRVDAWNLPPGTLSEAEVLGKTRWELPHSEMRPEDWAPHCAALNARRPFRDFVMAVRTPEAGTAYLSLSGEPIFDAAGNFSGYWGVGRGVTGEVQAQRALAESEGRYRDLFERTPTPLVLHRRGVAALANRAAAGLFGYADAQAMAGVDLIVHYPTEQRDSAARRVAALEAMPVGGELPVEDFRIVACDGSVRHVQATGVRVLQADGPATLSIYFDITERVRADAALRRSEQMLARLFEASPDAIVVSEIDSSRILMVNGQFESLFGFRREEIVGRRSLDLDLWADTADRQRLVEALRRDGVVHDVPVRRRARDGRVVRVLYSAAKMRLDEHDYFVGTMRDVAAGELARLKQEAILRNASVGIAFTRNRVFELVNPEFEAMFGWAPGTLIGRPGSDVWRSAADYAEIGAIAGPMLSAGKPVDLERPMRRHDGSEFWCHLRARVVDPDDPAGGGTIWIAEDITEKRAFDDALAAAKEGAEAASRAKSEFLANMSHEIRTPLNGVLGLARLALLAEDGERRDDYLKRLIDSADALAAQIADTLDLSKIEAGKLTLENVSFNLRELVDGACAAYREVALAKGIGFDTRVGEGCPQHVLGDPVRVRQILGNFVSNAVKFTQTGRVDVDVRCRPGGQVRLTVADSGIGIAPEVQARLFEPFTQGDASTTRRFGGTGLGLSICRRLAELMHGRIGFASTPGAGSTFWVDLPLPSAPDPAAAPAPVRGDQPLHGLRVLLVEDNAVNMLIAEQLLVYWGAQVTPATDGRQAIDAVERAQAGFDVVLMDVHMPEMGGHEATAVLRQRYAKDELPIVALTAAALVSEREQSLAVGMNDFIAKPIDAGRMIEVLLRVTAPRRGRMADHAAVSPK